MVSTFINPVVNPDRTLGVSAFTETDPVRRWEGQSADEVAGVIRAIYKQVLGNAYVMASERSEIAESQFRRGECTVIEFIRQLAYSDVYRTRLFENGTRTRFIELNFKHFLGRAPENAAEIAIHSNILDAQGYQAEIDSYLDSDEYYQTFGTEIVPFYRGYKTEASTPTGFTYMLSLLRGSSSSDKQVVTNQPGRLLSSIFANRASTISSPSGAISRQRYGQSVEDLLKNVFNRPATTLAMSSLQIASEPAPTATNTPLAGKARAQAEEIAQLKQQLNDLRAKSNIGAAILRKGQRPPAPSSEAPFGRDPISVSAQVSDQAQEIEKLKGELMSARSLATIADFKLNKWRARSY